MSTAEATTISMLDRLSDRKLFNVQDYLKQAVARRKEKAFLRPLSKKEIYKILDDSRKDCEAGRTIPAEVVRERTRAKYGI